MINKKKKKKIGLIKNSLMLKEIKNQEKTKRKRKKKRRKKKRRK